VRRAPSFRTATLFLLLALSALAPAVAQALTVEITASIGTNTSWGLPGSGSTV